MLGKGQSSETYFALALSNNEFMISGENTLVMISLYLLTGCLPKTFKVAIIKPLLKKFSRVAVKHGAYMII